MQLFTDVCVCVCVCVCMCVCDTQVRINMAMDLAELLRNHVEVNLMTTER